jgi:hypothetical protein
MPPDNMSVHDAIILIGGILAFGLILLGSILHPDPRGTPAWMAELTEAE